MAIIWQKEKNASLYQVRTAGASVRLYTDGVFHSQWNPNAPLSGSLWDLLSLPALLAPKTPDKVALLGVGGGAVLKQLEFLFGARRMVGVDLDKTHLDIARRFFGVNTRQTELVHDCAKNWVKQSRGQKHRFDYVVEDLFTGKTNNGTGKPEAVRAVAADREWLACLASLLSANGVLVMNLESTKQARSTIRNLPQSGPGAFSTVFVLEKPLYHNAIAVFMKKPLPAGVGKKSLQQQLKAFDRYSANQLNKVMAFSLRRIR